MGLDCSQTQLLKGLPGLNGVDAFRQEGLVRVLAEPTLVTVVGRPARFQSGGEVLLWNIGPDGQLVQRPEHYGTYVDVVPRLTDKHDLRLELRFEYSEVDRTRTVFLAGKENPAIRKRAVVTTLAMKFGETFALSGPSPAAGSGATGSASMVMLVSAETVEPIAASQPSDRPQRQ